MEQGYQALTDREKQTLRLLLEGHDAKSIARHFGLSVHTINERLRDARRKLAVSSSREAARRLREIEGSDPEIVGDAAFGGSVAAPIGQSDVRSRRVPHRLWRGRWAIGVFAMLSLDAATLLLTAPSATPPQAGGTTPATAIADTDVSRAARQWLALVDAGRWRESWEATGRAFQSLNTVDVWRSASEQARAPLGAMVSRTLIGEDDAPVPPHGYRIVRFRTVFARRTAIETLSLDREPAGWKVVGIYIE